MDLTRLFCEIDDFCCHFSVYYEQHLLNEGQKQRRRPTRLSLSEMMTIVIYYHHRAGGYRDFKSYYQHYVEKYMTPAFPQLLSYSRFMDLLPRLLLPMSAYLTTRKGAVSGIAFIDSMPLKVCHNRRIYAHKVFQGIAQRGKSSMGWFYGLKLHLVINELGEILAVQITPGNTDDRTPVPKMVTHLFGKLFADRGYISKKLFKQLMDQGLELISYAKKSMKPRVLKTLDRLILRKRNLIETVNDQLKNISEVEHSRHRSPLNALIHICAGLIAYSWQPKKPAMKIHPKDMEILHGIIPGRKLIAL